MACANPTVECHPALSHASQRRRFTRLSLSLAHFSPNHLPTLQRGPTYLRSAGLGSLPFLLFNAPLHALLKTDPAPRTRHFLHFLSAHLCIICSNKLPIVLLFPSRQSRFVRSSSWRASKLTLPTPLRPRLSLHPARCLSPVVLTSSHLPLPRATSALATGSPTARPTVLA
jgi:hypothetical protein